MTDTDRPSEANLDGYNYLYIDESDSMMHIYKLPEKPHSNLLADIIHRSTDLSAGVETIVADFSDARGFDDENYPENIRSYLLSGTGEQINQVEQMFPRRTLVLRGLTANLYLTKRMQALIQVYFEQLPNFSRGNINLIIEVDEAE